MTRKLFEDIMFCKKKKNSIQFEAIDFLKVHSNCNLIDSFSEISWSVLLIFTRNNIERHKNEFLKKSKERHGKDGKCIKE